MTFNLVTPSQWTASLNPIDNRLLVGGQAYWVQNASQPWDLTSPSDDVLRFEVRPGDIWTSQDTAAKERSEIGGMTNYATGAEVDLRYGFRVEPGAANTAAWLVVGQLHQDAYTGGSPPFGVYLDGEQMEIRVGFTEKSGAAVQQTIYLDPASIQRGHVYDIRVAATFDPSGNGALVVWRDGEEIANYRGALGYTGQTSSYFKAGVYRAASTETFAADYSNVTVMSSSALSNVGAPLASQLTLKASLISDTGLASADLVSSQGAVDLSGVATATRLVTVRDGGTVLGTIAVATGGRWSWSGVLAEGVHSLNVTAVSASGVASASSTVQVVVDRSAPFAPVVTGVLDDGTKGVHRLEFAGTAEAGVVVKVLLDDGAIGTATADATGHWTCAAPSPVGVGIYKLAVTATDLAGNSSVASAAEALAVDDGTLGKTTFSDIKLGETGSTISGTADSTVNVAILSYQFFTGLTPTANGMEYLISSRGGNPYSLSSAYYSQLGIVNRYINFAVNLGSLGEGASAFQRDYGALSLEQAVVKAYGVVFGSPPSVDKVRHLLHDLVPNGVNGSYERESYFSAYGQDGLSGQGTKAAMAGWLLSVAAGSGVGVYALSNNEFLWDVARGQAVFGIDLIGHYAKPVYSLISD